MPAQQVVLQKPHRPKSLDILHVISYIVYAQKIDFQMVFQIMGDYIMLPVWIKNMTTVFVTVCVWSESNAPAI